MNDILALAAHNTIIGLVLALFVYGLTRIWRSPPVAHLLWLLVLAKLVAPPIVHVEWSAFGLPSSTHPRGQVITDVSPARGQEVENGSLFGWSTGQRTAHASATNAPEHDFAAGLWRAWDRERPLLVWFWLGGAVVCAIVSATRIVRFERLLRDTLPASARLQQLASEIAGKFGIRRVPDVHYVECVEVPMVWCAGRRPTIVLPMRLFSQFDDQQISMILAHELAHLRRRDHWVRGVEMVVSIIYWWNPLVWLIRRQLHHAEELCCDAWVRYVFPDGAKRYAEVVLKAAESYSALKFSARLLPASMFLHSLSLKRRIEMILESRFAPSVSMKAMLVIALLAGLVLPLFVETTRAETPPATRVLSVRTEWAEIAAGSTDKTPVAPVRKPDPPARPARKRKSLATFEFPYVVKFQQGAAHFLDGDNITIVEVRGTADMFIAGNIYWIRGTYTLASHDRAGLAAFTTAKNDDEGTGKYFAPQKIKVTKGSGTFTVFLPMLIEGWPHVSFYPADGGDGFGDSYLGTGDSVLKRGWWESKEASASHTPHYLKTPGQTAFIVGHSDGAGWEMLQRQDPYKHQNEYGHWPITDVYKKELKSDTKPGDTVLALISLHDLPDVPEELSDLLLLPRSEIESRLKQGQTVFKQGKVRGMNVFLVATPALEVLGKEFRRLVAEGKFTPDK